MLLLFLVPGNTLSYSNDDCIVCHVKGLHKSDDGAVHRSALLIDMDRFTASAHGDAIGCNDCHTGIMDKSHQDTRGSGAVNCNACHDQENRHGINSVETRPKCFSCHTKHSIKSKDSQEASIHSSQLDKTCRGCHPRESGNADYLTWFTTLQVSSHKKQDFGHSYSRRNCLGCHQGMASHGGMETISPDNCQVCHQSKKGASILLGKIHPNADLAEQAGIFTAAVMYQIALVFLICGGIAMVVSKRSDINKQGD